MLTIQPGFLGQMRDHARRAYPEECCGIFLGTADGDEKKVHELLELTNSSEQQRTRRYLVRPEDYLRAETEARNKGLDVLGFYHSHPDHPARPSQFDLEHAFPFWSYLIISVEKGEPVTMASWLLRDDRSKFDEEEFDVAD